jgi:autotransporter-associated beta strand protein
MQFASDGYVVTGDPLTLVGPQSIVRVGDATAAGAGYTATVASSVTGTTELNKTDLGTLILAGANTYTGGTRISSGTLQISSDANLGAPTGALTFDGAGATLRTTANIASNRTVTINGPGGTVETAAGWLLLDNVVSGAGSLSKTGDGLLALTHDNTYNGGTFISAGTVQISTDTNLGAASSGLTFDGGTLLTTADITSSRNVTINGGGGTFNTDAGSTFRLESGAVGSGELTKTGTGTLLLLADNIYTGGTRIDAGTLQIGDCGTTGSIVGNVLNNSLLVFNRSDTSTYSGTISGSGAVIKNCTGTQVLRGPNTYAGGTLINAGTLVGDTRSLRGTIVDNAALGIDQDTDGTFDGVIGGTGTLTKTGAGTVLLTGDHPLAGLTTVQAGTLALDGRLLGAVNVAQGAMFDATGAIGGALNVDGTVNIRTPSNGDAFGLLAVGGDVAFNPGSHFGVGIDPNGGNSALSTPGAAAIDGAVVDISPNPGQYGRVSYYALLRADGGLTGTATASTSLKDLDLVMTQSSTTLFLTILRTDVPLQSSAVTTNGSSIGGALDRLKGGATGDLRAVARELTALDDASLGRALAAISGEIYASSKQLAAIDGESVMDIVRSEVATREWVNYGRADDRARRSGSSAAPWGSRDHRAWIRFRAEDLSFDPTISSTPGQDGLAGSHGADGALSGFAMGADWALTDRWLFGLGASYATGHLYLDGLNERSTFAAPRGLVYVGYARPHWGIDSGFSLAATRYDIQRAFAFKAYGPMAIPLFGGVERVASSAPWGLATEGWTEARLNAPLGSWAIQPAIGIRVARLGLNDWRESGADALSLRADGQATYSTQADGGLRFTRAAGRVRPYIGGMYRRELASGRTTSTVQIGDTSGGLFGVDGLLLARDIEAAQTGFIVYRDRFTLTFGYDARRARRQLRQTLQFAVGF